MAELIKEKKSKYFDYLLLFIVLFLLGFGLVMIYSTSSYTSSLEYDGDALHYLKKQAIAIVIGLVMMFVVSFIDTKIYRTLYFFIFAASVLSILLILTPLGHESHGARRWIYIGSLSIQPAEIAKIGVIILVAALLSGMTRKERNGWKGVLLPLFYTGVVCVMIAGITSNFSSAIIIGLIAFSMVCVAQGPNYRSFVVLLAVLFMGFLLVMAVVKGWGGGFLSFRGQRILAWINPEEHADGKGYQTIQALYGIGSGGVFGKGLGKSMQKLGFLPEPYNDMIFSVICEELGLFGGIAIIAMFLLLLYRIYDVASHTADEFDNLLLCGIFAHIAVQVILNIAVVTNTIPNTGISLPFISYGGSSVIFLLIEMGIVMRISRNCSFRPKKAAKKQQVREENEET